MMKKLLALFLALMLPAAALAQTSRTELKITVDEEIMTRLFNEYGVSGDEQTQKLNAVVIKLMNGLGFSLTSQDNGGALEVLVGGKPLLDVTALEVSDELIITTSLSSGYGMKLPLQALETENPVEELLAGADLELIVSNAAAAAAVAAQGVEVSTVRGSFSGDAYAGGVYCTTIRLDDSDVAAILSALMTEELRALVTSLLDAMELDAKGMLQKLDTLHQNAAQKNEHLYIIRLVSDENQKLIGASAVVLRGDAQLVTLSLGFGDASLRLVFGAGMGTQNYWFDFVMNYEQKGNGAFTLDGTAREFLADKDEGFRVAAAMADTFLAITTCKLDVSPYQSGTTWIYSQNTTATGSERSEKIVCNGMTISDHTLVCSLKRSLNDAEYLTVSFEHKPAATLSVDPSSLTLCDLSVADEAQEALLEEMGEEVGVNLMMRLLQVIPMELLTTLMSY